METVSWICLDHARLGHAGDAAHLADVRGDALQGHDGHGAGLLGDLGLLGVGDVHDDAALEHLGQAHLVAEQLRDLLVAAGSLHDSASWNGHIWVAAGVRGPRRSGLFFGDKIIDGRVGRKFVGGGKEGDAPPGSSPHLRAARLWPFGYFTRVIRRVWLESPACNRYRYTPAPSSRPVSSFPLHTRS